VEEVEESTTALKETAVASGLSLWRITGLSLWRQLQLT
jgi:hypothetical protein